MKTWRYILLGAALGLSGPVLSMPGYFPLSDARLPVSVRSAAKAVFRLQHVAKRPIGAVAKGDREQYLSLMSGFMRSMIQARYTECDSGALEPCPIHYDSLGTGFMVTSGKRMLTAKHFFKTSPTDDDLVVYDAEGKVVWDTRDSRYGKVRYTNFTAPEEELDPLEWLGEKATDVVRIEFPRPLTGAYLNPTTARVDNIFMLGFPQKTTNRKLRYKAADSDGKSIQVMMGRAVTAGKFIGALLGSKIQPDVGPFEVPVSKAFLFLDADAEVGASGAPILNDAGQVVGMLSESIATDQLSEEQLSVPNPFVSMGIRLSWIFTLQTAGNN